MPRFLVTLTLLPLAAGQTLPDWLDLHAEQRARYETSDRRYRPGETGGDQQLPFRTRLQAGVRWKRLSLYSEVQDSRAGLTDSGSTVNATHVTRTRLLQANAGYLFEGITAHNLHLSIEAGRFSRDFGGRRLIGRNNFRNTTNTFDGVIVNLRSASGNRSVQVFDLRPVTYTYPDIKFDARYRDARLKGVFGTALVFGLNTEVYLIHMNDGERAPLGVRRDFSSLGFRAFHTYGPWSFEAESIGQFGRSGGLRHRAFLVHGQAGYEWQKALRPKVSMLYDYASGDRNPTDGVHGAFDSLYGPRRFEFGPTGTWGIYARSNLNSPAAQVAVRPTKKVDLSVTHRLLMLAQARDQWRGVGLADPSGRAGSYVGQQTEYRVRYRWLAHAELDAGCAVFLEGSFVRAVRPLGTGWGRFFYVANEWRF